jgi:hypothetical protein
MLGVMDRLEARQLGRQVDQIAEALAQPEELVIHLVKALDNPFAPRLPLGDKHDLHAQVQADEEAETARVPQRLGHREIRVQDSTEFPSIATFYSRCLRFSFWH